MKLQRFGFCPLLLCAVSAFAQTTPRAIELHDILAWKRIQAPVVSSDGAWFAYRLGPAEGNAEVVVRNLKSGAETRYPAGDRTASAPTPAAGGGRGAAAPGGDLAFSDDGKWVAFTVWPLTPAAKRMRAQHRPIQTKVVLVELATGKKTEFEKIRRFAFSGEKSSAIALYRYGAEPAGGRGGAASGATPSAPGAAGATPPDRPQGADLILYNLSSASEMNIGNVSEFSFDKKGDWLAWVVDAQDKAGNGVELRNMTTGAEHALDSSAASYKSLTWTEKGDALAALRGVDDKSSEDKLYSVVAFKDLGAAQPAKAVFDPKDDPSFPKGMTVSPNRPPMWREDLSAVLFGIHEVKPKKSPANGPADGAAETDGEPAAAPQRPAPAEDDKPSLVLWHYKDPRLQSQQEVQENADKNFSFLASYSPGDKNSCGWRTIPSSR